MQCGGFQDLSGANDHAKAITDHSAFTLEDASARPAAACVLAAPRALAGVGRRKAPTSKLNIALLGCGGRMGQILGSALQLGDNIVAICDVDATASRRLKQVAARNRPARPRPVARPRSTTTTASCWTRRSRSTPCDRRGPALARADEQGGPAGRQARLLREAAGPQLRRGPRDPRAGPADASWPRSSARRAARPTPSAAAWK